MGPTCALISSSEDAPKLRRNASLPMLQPLIRLNKVLGGTSLLQPESVQSMLQLSTHAVLKMRETEMRDDSSDPLQGFKQVGLRFTQIGLCAFAHAEHFQCVKAHL